MTKIRDIISRFNWVWVSLYFLALSLVMTWPLVLRMGNEIVGRIGDNIYFIWLIGWVRKALFDLGVNPFDVWHLNYPEGWSLAYTEITPIQIAMAIPFDFIGGHTFAYNAVMLLSFILSGLGMYLWIYKLTGKVGPALIAGTIFAFTPYHFAHFRIGHLNLSGTQWFPFYFYGFFELLKQKEFSWKMALLTGMMLGLIGLTSQYYLYMTVLVSTFIGLVVLLFYRRDLWKSSGFWKNSCLALAVSLPLIIAAIYPYVALQRQGGLPDRNISIVRLYSASITDFLLPSTDHFLWGGWVGNKFNRDLWPEATLYLGTVAIVLAGVAFVKGRAGQQGHLLRWLLIGTLFSIILAMGINLHWNEQSVMVSLPQFLAERLNRDSVPIPLPGFVLFYIFPYYAKMRALMRFGIFAILFVSAAAGLGSEWILSRLPARKVFGVSAALLVLVFIDLYPGPYTDFAPIRARPVDYWLKEQPGSGAIVQMPFELAEDQEQTYYTLIHDKPYVGGFFNAFPPSQYERIRPILNHFPDEESIELLRELRVKYVLVDRNLYPEYLDLNLDIQGFGLEHLVELDGQIVYELNE